MGVPQITIAYLRNRAAHYRQLMAKTSDPHRANRYPEFSELLESRSIEASEPHRLARPWRGRGRGGAHRGLAEAPAALILPPRVEAERGTHRGRPAARQLSINSFAKRQPIVDLA
jgi:hypothetical protein